MTEIARLPETVTGFPGCKLLVNTGCMLVKLGPWVDHFPGFWIQDAVRKINGKWHGMNTPEDWNFSFWAQAHGLKVGATKLPLSHWGPMPWSTETVWGQETAGAGELMR